MTPEEMRARFEQRQLENAPAVAQVDSSQTEKSRKAVLEEIRGMIKSHPEMSDRDIALEVGATPKQVTNQRYLMSKKLKPVQGKTDGAGEHKPRLKMRVKVAEFVGEVCTYEVDDGEVSFEVQDMNPQTLKKLIGELQDLLKIIENKEAKAE